MNKENKENIDSNSFTKGLWSSAKGFCLFVFGYLPFILVSIGGLMFIGDYIKSGYVSFTMAMLIILCLFILGGLSLIVFLILMAMRSNQTERYAHRIVAMYLSGINVLMVIVFIFLLPQSRD